MSSYPITLAMSIRTIVRQVGVVALGAALLGPLSGCVVWDIRNEMRKTNTNLVEVQERLTKLDQTNSSLDRTNERLEKANALIDNVERGLGRIDSTNNSLSGLEQQLVLLKSIDKSLNHLDQHLASLRKTINKLDGVIPFLDLGGDAPVEPTAPASAEEPALAAADGVAPVENAAAATPAATAPGTAAPAAAAKRDPLTGTWLTQYPSRDNALVLLADGRYFWATRTVTTTPQGAPSGGSVTIEKGTWTRKDAALSLQADPTVVPADPKQPNSKPTTKPGRSWSLSVIAQTAKSATVEIDGNLTVLSRP